MVPKTRVSYLCPKGFCLTDNSYGYVPLLEDSEARKNNLTLDRSQNEEEAEDDEGSVNVHNKIWEV